MATSFPSGLDALTNPTSANGLNSPDHAGQHADANDAIEALEAKVGVNGSAVATSLDYKITNIDASNLTTGTVPSARVAGAYTGVTSVGTLGSLTVDTDTLRVDSGTSRVGVGTTSPTTKLEVAGSVTATDFRLSTKSMPRGIAGLAHMSSNYTLTTTATALTSVTWTAVAGRYYRVTYFEPEAQTTTVSGGSTFLQIRAGATAAGGELSSGVVSTAAAVQVEACTTVSYITDTYASGSQTVNASARTSSTTGAPILVRGSTSRAFLMVEDLGIF